VAAQLLGALVGWGLHLMLGKQHPHPQ
jgi:hypothetical protein